MSALAYGREDWYSAPGWYYWFAFQAACAMAVLGWGTMARRVRVYQPRTLRRQATAGRYVAPRSEDILK